MATYTSSNNQPFGLESVTINSVSYVVVSPPTFSPEGSRTISRTDANGDSADFQIRPASTPQEDEMTVQRASDSTDAPPEKTEFSYDYDRSGTSSTLVCHNVRTNRGTDDMDTFTFSVTLVTYQG